MSAKREGRDGDGDDDDGKRSPEDSRDKYRKQLSGVFERVTGIGTAQREKKLDKEKEKYSKLMEVELGKHIEIVTLYC